VNSKPLSSTPKYTIKQILLSNQNWWQFYNKNKETLRPGIVIGIVKLLSCRNSIRGYHEYRCSNPNCSHIKFISHTCKSKACSSCGKKATEMWIQKQQQILPNTTWQHITFTMPEQLWDFFWYNRSLLNHIASIAANAVKTMAKKKNIIPGIFIAIHTFGRDLKRNVHIHLSVTLGGLSQNYDQWKKISFHQTILMRIWRYAIIALFRTAHKQQTLTIPTAIQKQLSHAFTFNHFLDQLYQKIWIVHCSKPSKDHKHNVDYLSRYIKRPPIAESKLKHYDGNEVTFRYLDHTTKIYRNFKLTAEQFIERFIQHIPDVGFRMIRYYGFLAHRVRSKLLPMVYKLLGQEARAVSFTLTFAQLMWKNFQINPLSCILCGQPLLLFTIHFGNTSSHNLLTHHRQLALLKKI
jgi:hypothetical protein